MAEVSVAGQEMVDAANAAIAAGKRVTVRIAGAANSVEIASLTFSPTSATVTVGLAGVTAGTEWVIPAAGLLVIMIAGRRR